MKDLNGRIGGQIDLAAMHCTRQDLLAVRHVRQELGGVVSQLPVRWYESAEGAILLRTYTLLCAVELYLAAEETKVEMKSEPAETNIAKFLGEVCHGVVLAHAVEEGRKVYAGMESGVLSPACVLGAAYKPLYDEGYVYTGLNAVVLSAMKEHYETVSSVIAPVNDAVEGSLLFSKGENAAQLITAIEGLFRLYAGMVCVTVEPVQDAIASKYRTFTISDHVGKTLSEVFHATIRTLSKAKEV